ncbi:transketolase [Pseudoxanthobacter sp.]|uniref:transketolase n=1 Tax=Pseudoxanthobacter sp. TaxID=1925742 RepID=UPI002FE38D6C
MTDSLTQHDPFPAGAPPAGEDADSENHALLASAVRLLAIDAVEAAASGHPGLPLGAADVATVLFGGVMKFDPTSPWWPDRDRFVLSAGHGSALLYALLHLTGYEDFSLEVLKRFRQLGSPAAGHPEYGAAAGIETTTGPLGQGLANAVGMALAERMLNARFGDALVDHRTWVLASDGDLMEGLSQEAISIAGHLKLNRLTVLWDNNGISIDGAVSLTESGDMLRRFEAAGWEAVSIDGHDPGAILAALQAARDSDRPTLIGARTVIGRGAPGRQGTAAVHGAPLGPAEAALTRAGLGFGAVAPFEVPCEVRDLWRMAGLRCVHERKAWEKRYRALPPEERGEFDRRMRGQLPPGLGEALSALSADLVRRQPAMATRKASELALEVIAGLAPELVGGSADLSGSNNTLVAGQSAVAPGDYRGTYVHWGIREHAMAAAMNGLALHGGFLPYGGTFLVFSDYCRPAIRLAALMGVRVVFVMTHDSIGLGEDGPTHQPVEHLAGLRIIPGLTVLRPADAVETAECWQAALERAKGPAVLVLSRQSLPALREREARENLTARGAYELRAAGCGPAQVTLFASGSEVSVAVAARAVLEEEGIGTRVVSVPSFELFCAQSPAYRAEVTGTAPVRIAVEAAIRTGWDRFIGDAGHFVGMSGFGASAPAGVLFSRFGITPLKVVEVARAAVARTAGAPDGPAKAGEEPAD